MATLCCTPIFTGCHGAVLERFVTLFPHTTCFLEEIYHPVAKLDTRLKIRLSVLADIFRHLNKLNLLLQGQQKLLCNLYEAVDEEAFSVNGHAESGNVLQFPLTREVCGEDKEHTQEDKPVLVDVLKSTNRRQRVVHRLRIY